MIHFLYELFESILFFISLKCFFSYKNKFENKKKQEKRLSDYNIVFKKHGG